MEIERKFIVREPPEVGGYERSEIDQGYLAVADTEGGAEVRLRRWDGGWMLTVKSAGGEVREEEEIELDEDEFERLWPLTADRRLEKTRYVIPLGDLQIELDVYAGALGGLVVAEVEFPDEAAAKDFEAPEWFGEEVTGKEPYKNETLATKGLPDDDVQAPEEGIGA